MTDDLEQLEGVRFFEVHGEPICGVWIDGILGTGLEEFGTPQALVDALYEWNLRWYWSTSNPEGAAQVLCDEQALALAHALKTWVVQSVEVRFTPIVGPQVVIDDPR